MKCITIGPTGSRSLSRMQGTKVRLAGRKALLPNADVPFVLQRLTMRQIEAIPKDKFAVSLIEVPTWILMAGLGKKGQRSIALRGLQRMKALARTGVGMTGYVRAPSGTFKVEIDGTKLYTTMITMADQIKAKAVEPVIQEDFAEFAEHYG